MLVNERTGWLIPAVLAILAIAPFLTGLRHDFVYDDHGVVVENAFVGEPANLLRVLTLQTLGDPDVVDGQRPVVVATYLVDRWAWGLWPPGYRITNLLLHGANVALVFLMFQSILGATLRRSRGPGAERAHQWLAALAALLFAWHPLAVEPAQSPSFREDTLYVLGGLIFLRSGLRAEMSAWRWAGGALAYVLALLSKESAAVFPILLATGWWLFPALRPSRKWILRIVVVAGLLTAGYGAVVYGRGSLQSLGGEWNGLSLRGTERIWTPPWLAYYSQQKMMVPHPLSVDYRLEPVSGPADPRFIAGVFFVALELFLIWRFRRRLPALAFALAWMLIAFAPVSNLLPLFNPQADRYAYGMLPGFVLALVFLFRFLRLRGGLLAMLVLAGYLAVTLNRLGEWRNDRTLWQAALKVEPRSARAHTWLGLLEKEDGRREIAWNYFVRAEQLNPHDVSPTVNLAIMLGEQGALKEAEMILRDVLQRRPDHKEARKNLAVCLELQGQVRPSGPREGE